MFKNYLVKSLDHNEYMKKNKDAPENQKYCNGLCQKFLDVNEFYFRKSNCKSCFRRFLKVENMVKKNQITFEKFRMNPDIVKDDLTIINIIRKCKTCEEEKTLEQFEAQRKECIECRRKKKKKNYEEEFKKYIDVIEEIKNDIDALKNLFRSMSVDLIKLAISHFQISVPHTERKKENMVVKLIEHFQSLLNPLICLGGCGNELNTEFSVCLECKNKKSELREEKYTKFECELDNLIENMKKFTDEDGVKYTKKQLILISRKLEIKVYNEEKKSIIVDKLKNFFEDRLKKEDRVIIKNKPDLSGTFEINGIIIQSREDGLISGTQICKAGKKEFKHWYSLESTKELILKLEEQIQADNLKVDIPTFKILDVQKGRYGGSWIHPDLAIQLAQWISPVFALQVSKWIRELALTGTVSLGAEKSNIELLKLQKDYKKLDDKYRLLLERKDYHKFKKGPVFYIISDCDSKSTKLKPGFEGVDINIRLQQHRSSLAGCKLEYLVYTEDALLLEKSILNKYRNLRKISNKEWIFDIDVKEVKKSVNTIADVINAKYTIEEDIAKYNEQIDLDFDFS
jgi:hypothetical protein